MDTEEPQQAYAQTCPECGQPLQTLWSFPSNEVVCPHCGIQAYQAESSHRIGRGSSESIRGFRVLLLDADPSRRDVLSRHLAHLGYQVTPVCHPRQLLEAASFQRFDLVLLGWSGRDHEPATLAKYLRRQTGPVPFVVYSCQQRSATAVSGEDAEGIIWIQGTPENLSLLEAKLEELIDDLVGSSRPIPRQSLVGLAGSE